MKRPTMRMTRGRWRDGGGDHLVWLCQCHDCRKRRKYGRVKVKPVWLRREEAKLGG